MLKISEKIEKVIAIYIFCVLTIDANPLIQIDKWWYLIPLCFLGSLRALLMFMVLILDLFKYIGKKYNERCNKGNKSNNQG